MKKIFSRLAMLIPAVLVQLLWYVLIFTLLIDIAVYLQVVILLMELFVVVYIINKRDEANYKLMWIVFILVLPFIGTWMYLASGNKRTARSILWRIERNNPEKLFKPIPHSVAEVDQADERLSGTVRIIRGLTGFSETCAVSPEFFSCGEEMFPDMLVELEKAEKFIFIEYFIIARGFFFDSVLEVLERKVRQGVDVRVMYDDIGSISTFSGRDRRELIKKGIKCVAFNSLVFVKMTLNNRDHRKMMIIDNRVCYSGGINLGDEYINKSVRFGYWKDTGFKFYGEGVKDYTRMFVLFWNAYAKDKIEEEKLYVPQAEPQKGDGCVISYYDSPAGAEPVSNKVFIDLLSQATEYAYFYTPYLILPDSLKEAFLQAAARGVDVRIIIPAVPDKKLIFKFTESYGKELAAGGVKIFKYTPGFIHAKACVVDDKVCTLGSVNLDYRSLYLHFECNSLFFNSSMVEKVKQDFLATEKRSELMTPASLDNIISRSVIGAMLRVFAPLV